MQATSKLRSPLPSPDRPLLRMRGRYLSADAAMPTMNIQISSSISKFKKRKGYRSKCALRSAYVYSKNIHCYIWVLNSYFPPNLTDVSLALEPACMSRRLSGLVTRSAKRVLFRASRPKAVSTPAAPNDRWSNL